MGARADEVNRLSADKRYLLCTCVVLVDRGSNSDLTLSMVRWLVREDHGPKVRPGIPVPALVLLTRNQMQRIFLGVEVFLPLSVMVVGVVVWWKRR